MVSDQKSDAKNMLLISLILINSIILTDAAPATFNHLCSFYSGGLTIGPNSAFNSRLLSPATSQISAQSLFYFVSLLLSSLVLMKDE